MFELVPTTTLLLTAAGTVSSAFVLKNLTGYSFGIETNKLNKVLAATALIFASGTIANEIKKAHDKENKNNLEKVEHVL